MAISRLKKRAEFLAARKGRRLNGPYFFIESLDRQDAGEPRYGLTVTRKVGNAVERNRIRRRLREAIRLECGGDMAPGHDYVVVARRELMDVPFATLTGELSRRFARSREARRDAGPAKAKDAGRRRDERPSGKD